MRFDTPALNQGENALHCVLDRKKSHLKLKNACNKKFICHFAVRSFHPFRYRSPKISPLLHLYLLFELPFQLNYAFKSWNLIETYFLSSSYFWNLKSHFVFIKPKSLFLSRTQSFSFLPTIDFPFRPCFFSCYTSLKA